jgi:hypothetical protein
MPHDSMMRTVKTTAIDDWFDLIVTAYVGIQNELVRHDTESGSWIALELEKVIVEYRNPACTGAVMEWEHVELRKAGLIYLIERDAKDHYDSIDVYLKFLCQVRELPEPIPPYLDGLGFCQWLDDNSPVVPVEDARKVV